MSKLIIGGYEVSGSTSDASDIAYKDSNVESALDNILKWKLVGSVTGANSVTLPSDFNELHVCVRDTSNQVRYTYHILKEDIPTSVYDGLLCGFSPKSSTLLGARINLSTSSVTLASVDANGTSLLSTATMTVYYR